MKRPACFEAGPEGRPFPWSIEFDHACLKADQKRASALTESRLGSNAGPFLSAL
jgi:hypothetical protein